MRRLTLTRTQFGLMRLWSRGTFVGATPRALPPYEITPHGLDKAAMENACGGAFYPGIEVGWQIRAPGLYAEPFRIDLNGTSQYWGEDGMPLRAGHFSRQMAVPWQADFNDCGIEGNFTWWPSQRPDDVFVNATDRSPQPWARATRRFAGGNVDSTHEDMLANWYKFGFVVEQWGGTFLETERAPQIP